MIWSFFFIIFLFSIQGIFAYFNIRTIKQIQAEAHSHQIEIGNLELQLLKNRLLVFRILGTMNPIEMDHYKEKFDAHRSYLEKRLIEEGIAPDVVETTFNTYQEIIALQYDFRNSRARQLIEDTAETIHESLIHHLEALSLSIVKESDNRVDRTYMKSLRLTIGLALGTLFVSILLAFFLARSLMDRRQAESAIRKQEEKYRTLVESSSDLIWEVDKTGAYTYVSPKVKDMLGYEPSEFLGKTPFDFMAEDEAGHIKKQFLQAVENQKAIERLENTCLHKEGHNVVLETSGVPIIKTDGTFQGYRGMDRDITVRKKTESDLRKREATLNSIFRAAPIGIGMVVDRVLTLVNDNLIAMTGYADKDLIGSSARLLYPNQDEFERVGQEKYAQIQKNGTGTVETKWKTKEGKLIDVLLSSTPLNPSDWSEGVTFTALDITGRKQSEKQLMDSERNYREIFNAANDVVMIHDKTSGEIVDVNSRVTDLYGYTPSELYGMTVESLSQGEPPFSMLEAGEWIKKTVEEGPQVFEWMARDKTGNAFWVEVGLKNAFIGGEERLLAVIRDIRQRKAADKELTEYREHLEKLVDRRAAEIKAKNKELEMFTYSVSHDLKAPLRGIDGYSRLLVEEYADRLDEEGLFFLNNVRQGTTQMNTLIEDLLAFSRTERKDLHHTSIDLNALIENLVAQRNHDIEQCRITVTVDLPFQTLESDTETLRQVLTNYLDNAIKYSKKDTAGTVTIGGSQDDQYWTLWVKDSGIGFDPKYLDRIFEIFQRLHRVEEYPGTGVGLAIVRKAVERIGGRVRANSSPGKGSTFYVDIPKTNPFSL